MIKIGKKFIEVTINDSCYKYLPNDMSSRFCFRIEDIFMLQYEGEQGGILKICYPNSAHIVEIEITLEQYETLIKAFFKDDEACIKH